MTETSKKTRRKEKIENPLTKIVTLQAPTYVNTTKVLGLGNVDFYLWDVVKASMAARLNLGLYSGAGMGKSQLLADLRALFGNNASYVLGRNDLDVKSLFRQLNFGKLVDAMNKGSVVAQQELTEVTKQIYLPLLVVEEINRCAEVVQNQFFNIFEGFIELDGHKHSLGGTQLVTIRDFDGTETQQNLRYSVGVWSANYGNGGYTGTVTMDRALKDRSHLIIDTDVFSPGSENHEDLDDILLGSSGEVRLKEQEDPADMTQLFFDAFCYLKQKARTPDSKELGMELLLFRYLVQGLDYIPIAAAGNSKREMKDVWPSKAEEDNIGKTDDEIILYRMVFPCSIRGALSIMSLARALREYAIAKDEKSEPDVVDSVIEAFKLVGAYSGIVENNQRIVGAHVGNPYRAMTEVAGIIKKRLTDASELMVAIIEYNRNNEPFSAEVYKACDRDLECWREKRR